MNYILYTNYRSKLLFIPVIGRMLKLYLTSNITN